MLAAEPAPDRESATIRSLDPLSIRPVSIVNIGAYRFTDLGTPDDLQRLRARILARAGQCGLRGTVLLASEGINLYLAGMAEGIDDFMGWLGTADEHAGRFAGLSLRRSVSADMPFRRLKVRIKREIIRMNRSAIAPAAGRAPALDSQTLRRWLDAGHDDSGRPLVLLDTRNGFEVDHGAFDGALDWRLERFSDFPAAASAHAHQLQGHTVVTYCTGGIRCEKAALLLREQGHAQVWQLEGGILQYLQDTGGAHWHGQCFVFDERVALDAHLQPQPQPQLQPQPAAA